MCQGVRPCNAAARTEAAGKAQGAAPRHSCSPREQSPGKEKRGLSQQQVDRRRRQGRRSTEFGELDLLELQSEHDGVVHVVEESNHHVRVLVEEPVNRLGHIATAWQ